MMKKLIAIVAVSILTFLGAPLFANDASEDYTEYKFEDDVLVGDRLGMDGVQIRVRPRGYEKSLLKIRTHFVFQMLKSVENI